MLGSYPATLSASVRALACDEDVRLPMTDQARFAVRVADRVADPSGAIQLELRPAAAALPRFTAGAHIDVFLPNGMLRSYSLMNDADEVDRYVCGVGRDRASRGGSAYLHDHVVTGASLTISAPKNLFPLDETAELSVLIAGGIGATPLIAMARRLNRLGRRWQAFYCARSRTAAPFLGELASLGPDIATRFSDECDGRYLDFPAMMAAAAATTHFYCCGPSVMIDAFNAAGAALPNRAHSERFAADEAPATEGGFTVELARSARAVAVPAGQTILEALEEAGLDVPFSCLAGICGSCVTRVIDGVPDHRDMVLTDRERSRNDQMMICCSGSLSKRLVLDL